MFRSLLYHKMFVNFRFRMYCIYTESFFSAHIIAPEENRDIPSFNTDNEYHILQ